MLKQDKNEFFAAASDAQKIAEYALALERGEEVKTWTQRVVERRQAGGRGR